MTLAISHLDSELQAKNLSDDTPVSFTYFLDGNPVLMSQFKLGDFITEHTKTDYELVELMDSESEEWRLDVSCLNWEFADDVETITPKTPIKLILTVTENAIVEKMTTVDEIVYMDEPSMALADFETAFNFEIYQAMFDFRNEHAESSWNIVGFDY